MKQFKPQEVCIGFSIEGGTLRMATVGRSGQKLNVMDQASMPLPVKQYAAAGIDDEEEGSKSAANPFDDFGGDEEATDDGIDYSEIREFIEAHYVPRASFSIGMEEPYLRTLRLGTESKEASGKIFKKIIDEIQKTSNVEVNRKAIAFQKVTDTSVIASARMEESPLIDIFTAAYGGQDRPTRINFLTSNDIAIINLVRVHFKAEPQHVVHVIHVDEDVTRFYVMKGNDIEYIAPTIQQGAKDAHLVSTLYNRIELTAENAGYLAPDQVVLSGHAEDIGLKEEIQENNPDVLFHTLKRLRLGHSEDEALLRDMPDYIIPISLAWQCLQPRNERFYRVDLTPLKIKEGQKIFKLAWHGVILFVVLFFAVMGLTVLGLQRQTKISSLSTALEFEKRQIEEQRIILNEISALEARSLSIQTATNTLDTLLLSSEVWSETLDTLAVGTNVLGDTWVSEIRPDKKGGMAVIGYAFKRSSIPTFSTAIGKTVLREVTVAEIGEHKLFRYDINLAVDTLFPYGGSRSMQWHDSLSTALGDVRTRIAAQEAVAASPPGATASFPDEEGFVPEGQEE